MYVYFSYKWHFIRPDGQPCVEAQEFGLIRNMLIAAVEERYKDAGNFIIMLWFY